MLPNNLTIPKSLPLPVAKATIGVDRSMSLEATLGYLTTLIRIPNLCGSDGLKDSNLESALIMFQKTNHLNVTGKLNPEIDH